MTIIVLNDTELQWEMVMKNDEWNVQEIEMAAG